MINYLRHNIVFALCLFVSMWAVASSVFAKDLDIAEGRAHFEAWRFEEAYKIIEPLAERGNAEAQYLLGIAYEDGPNLKLYHTARSLNWYLKAAKSGHLCARRRLFEILISQGRLHNEPPDDTFFRFFHLMNGPTNKTYSELADFERFNIAYHYEVRKSEYRRGHIVLQTWLQVAFHYGIFSIEDEISRRFHSLKYNELLVSKMLTDVVLSGNIWNWLDELRANWPTHCER